MKFPDKYRLMEGVDGGVFLIPGIATPSGRDLRVIASNGMGWDHVSVSLPSRCPTWPEMDFVKRLFWDDEEAVFQLHPPRSQWISIHPHCLHMWRPQKQTIPLPPNETVGIRI